MVKAVKLFALKPCSFGGKKFYIGDEIPAEYVADPAKQEKFGTLKAVTVGGEVAVADEAPAAPNPTISLSVKNDDGEMSLELTEKGIQDVFNVLMGKASNAEAIIEKMDDGDALILLHLTDARKTIKELAEARAKELAGEQ